MIERDLTQEFDLEFDFCTLRYGEGACPAVLGEDSDAKCHNTLGTCPVPDSYDPEPKALTFVPQQTQQGVNKIPSLLSVAIEASRLAGGTGRDSPLGERGKMTAVLLDHPWDDALVDKYYAERRTGAAGEPAYDPIQQGTFWPKFRARNPFYLGRDARLRTGLGGDIRERHYVLESIRGFSRGPTIVAKDPLKLADDERAQCPRASTGVLLSGITSTATALTLIPGGVGAEYPESGRASIGREYVAFTRSGDNITLTSRGLNGVQEAHAESDTFQIAERFEAMTAADIVERLLTEFSPVPDEVMPKSAWDAEMAFIQNVYTADIVKPTSVKQLIGELAEQAGFGIGWDDLRQEILLVAVKAPESGSSTITDDVIVEGSLDISDAPKKRISRVWTTFGQIDPVSDLEEDSNYRQNAVSVAPGAEDSREFGQPAIRKIFSRWIPQFGLSVALDLNSRLLARFQRVPRDVSFMVYRDRIDDIRMGSVRLFNSTDAQDRFGFPRPFLVRILSVQEDKDLLRVTAEEQISIQAPDLPRSVIIANDTQNFNLRTAHDQLFQPAQPGDVVTCVIQSSVVVGSDSASSPAFDTGEWPDGVEIVIEIADTARIAGRAGNAGKGGNAESKQGRDGGGGGAGGTALSVAFPVTISNLGTIAGGGGGGGGGGGYYLDRGTRFDDRILGGGGGGGGAGRLAGARGERGTATGSGTTRNGSPGAAGTLTARGAGGSGGSTSGDFGGSGGLGGNPGLPGANGQVGNGGSGSGNRGSGGSGGAAGAAIAGANLITFTETGTILGTQIN